MDLPGAAEHLQSLTQRFPKVTVAPISAASGEGLVALHGLLQERLLTAPT
jgi:hypothetical protein